jgi:nucleoside recognition membrane protein YjiH
MATEQSEVICNKSTWLKFIAGSLIGALFFLFPVEDDGVITIPIALLPNNLTVYLADLLASIVIANATISSLLPVWFSIRKSRSQEIPGSLCEIFTVDRRWLTLRILGCVTAYMIFFKIGPEFVWSGTTGHVVLYDLATAIVTIFIS